jgi:hypothetical protein
VLSRREREFLDDLATFRDDFRRAGGVRALHVTEEKYVRDKLDDTYGSRYVTVLRYRIRRRASAALVDLLQLSAVDADDPTVDTASLRSFLPNGFENTLNTLLGNDGTHSDGRASRKAELREELQATYDEFQAVSAKDEAE